MQRALTVVLGIAFVVAIVLGIVAMGGISGRLQALESKPAPVVDTAAIAKEVAAQLPSAPAAPAVDYDKLASKVAEKMAPSAGQPAASQPSSALAPSAGVTDTVVVVPPPSVVWAWHGRQGLDKAKGFNVEYIVEYPVNYVGTLEWWTCITGKCDEFGNDSIKGVDPQGPDGRWYLNFEAAGAFPKASWLNMPKQLVCENDESGCTGKTWAVNKGNVPTDFDKVMNLGHADKIPVYYDANLTQEVPGVYIIRWLTTANFNSGTKQP